MVVWFYSYLKEQTFEELPEMVPMLADKNNISIVLHLFKPESQGFLVLDLFSFTKVVLDLMIISLNVNLNPNLHFLKRFFFKL